jgi:spoIIIJ-associated protein
MRKTRIKGKTIEEAVDAAAKILGLERGQVEYRVISEGKPGILGVFGGEEAEVEAREKIGPGQMACDVLQEILNYMGLLAVAELKEEGTGEATVNIKGEDLGQIIGKEGAMLKALQILVSTMVGREFAERVRIYLDAGGYRERHENALKRLAQEAAKDVEATGNEKVLPPMSAADRRVIHMLFKDSEKISTYSKGEGADRRLVIAPK